MIVNIDPFEGARALKEAFSNHSLNVSEPTNLDGELLVLDYVYIKKSF